LALGLAVEAALVLAARAAGLGPGSAVLGLIAVGLVPVVAIVAYWVWGLASLRYAVSRDGIVIHWAASRQVVPMASITHVLAGRPYAAALRGLRWTGHEVGRTVIRDDEDHTHPTLVYATTPPAGQIVVVTPSIAYAISPADRSAFIEDFKRRRRLGPVQHLDQQTEQARWARLGLWHDPLGLSLLGLGILLCALGFAYIAWYYPALPPELALQYRYDPVVNAEVPGPLQPLSAIWRLPRIGLALLAGNALLALAIHRRARLGALLLIMGAIFVQAALLVVLARVT
jgi:hypothetical protein